MPSIKYEHFKKIIDEFEVFNIDILKVLYSKFDKQFVDGYFERYFNSLDETEVDKFMIKFAAYFEQKEKDEEVMDDSLRALANNSKEQKIVNDVVYAVCFSDSKCSIMSSEEEKKYGYDLLNGRNNLKVICSKSVILDTGRGFRSRQRNVKVIPIYPKLKLEDIFLSICDFDSLDYLKNIKRLPYSLGDDCILSDDINDIKKYLLLCKNGIPDINILKEEFPHLHFNNANVLSKTEIDCQLSLLKDYIIARYNYYRRNLKLIISVAKRFNGMVPLEDAFQMGATGLARAIDRFDVSKGNKFSTYATWWIRQAISRDIMDTSSIIRIPVHMTETINKYRKFINDYYMEYLREPSLDECADALGISADSVSELSVYSLDVVSLDAPVLDADDENDTLSLFVADENVSIEEDALKSYVSEQLIEIMKSSLKEKEIFVLYNRFGFDENHGCRTLEEVGTDLGVTRERVRQIEKNAIRKLKRRTQHLR